MITQNPKVKSPAYRLPVGRTGAGKQRPKSARRFLAQWFWCLFIGAFAVSAAPAFAAPFSDIEEGAPYFLAVNNLAEQNITDGFEDGSFRPDEKISRAETISIIMKLREIEDGATKTKSEIEPAAPRKKPFRDVKKSNPYFDAIWKAKHTDIIDGTKKGKYRYFRPNRKVTLAEALRMLFNAKNIDARLIEADMPPGIKQDKWYAKDIAYAVSRTMLLQQEDGTIFPPERTLTRGELVLILHRFLQTGDNMTFGYASWYGDGLAKTKIPFGDALRDQHLTAAHKTLPLGSIVETTNVKNGKTVRVVIYDRGPYVTGRIIDLSRTAFSNLAPPGAGVIQIQLNPIYVPTDSPLH